jgi:hypothetical protein
MAQDQLDEFSYRYPHSVFGNVPGAHTGSSMGSGDRFAGFADLFDYPDPRRLDIRASLRSNMVNGNVAGNERWQVRRYQQRSSINLWLLADMTRSMEVANPQHAHLAKLAQLIAYSAVTLGDRFAMLGFDNDWRQDVSVMPTRQRSMPIIAADMIRNAAPAKQPGAQGLLHASDLVTGSHGLVFLASDFCYDISLVEQMLRKLGHLTIVPIVWQHNEVDHLPSHAGWTEMRDAETGQNRSVWMRKSIRNNLQQARRQHFEQLSECFLSKRIQPIFVNGEVTGEMLSRYFLTIKKS